MRALGFEPKKEEIKKMIADIDKDGSGTIGELAPALQGGAGGEARRGGRAGVQTSRGSYR